MVNKPNAITKIARVLLIKIGCFLSNFINSLNNATKRIRAATTLRIIGYKVMILNARQIHFKADSKFSNCPPIILLAMEDVTEIMGVAKKMADHTNSFEKRLNEEMQELKSKITKLEGKN